VFLIFALIFDLVRGSENRPEWMTQSRTYPLLRASGDALIGFVNEHRSKAD
jgi:membrane protein required for colicin V production